MSWNDIKIIIKHKVLYILVIGVLGAVCAAGAKYLFTPDSTLKGDFIYSRVIKINDSNKAAFNYAGLIVGNASYANFIKNANTQAFDYSKVYSNWNRIDDQKKIEWLQRSIRVRGYKDNTFEFSYLIPSSHISDLPYLEKNGEKWMDGFMVNAGQMLKKARPQAKIQTVKSSFVSPKIIKNDKRSILLRNAAYGFIAGIFLSAAVFVGISFYKQR